MPHPLALQVEPALDPLPAWERSVIVFVDVVESVRLMQLDEAGVIQRWRRFVADVAADILPPSQGRLVKSLGDGMLLEFVGVPAAVSAAHAMQAWIQRGNSGHAPALALWLRMGVHVAQVIRDQLDLYGSGVNLGARIAAAARPGEVLVSAEARDQLVPELDGDIEDMGECYLKHVEGTQRLFRVKPLLARHAWRPENSTPTPTLRPTIAVAPMRLAEGATIPGGLAAALADNLVAALARAPQWVVTSRLSTAALNGRPLDTTAMARVLGVQYLVSCTLQSHGDAVEVRTDIFEAATRQNVWQGARRATVAELLTPEDTLTQGITHDVSTALLKRQISLAHDTALPTLAGYTLLLSAIASLHSLGAQDMHRSRTMLEHLAERHPRAPEAQVWLAKWHFLQIAQATSADRPDTVRRARAQLDRALAEAPGHALALALSGHMAAYVDGDMARAESWLTQAVQAGPNESLASLFLAQLLVNTGRAPEAVLAVEHATALSPLDPLGYYYDVFAASAYSAAGRHEEALAMAQRSLRQNTLHLSTWVQLIIEQVLTGRLEESRASASRYLVMRPAASVRHYLENHAARALPLARRNADALLQAGLPW